MDIEDSDYKIKKWTKKQREEAVALREKHGYGPKKISQLTGMPIDQIRFWIYGSRTKKASKRSKNAKDTSKRQYYRTKYKDWYTWKSQTLRSALRKRHPESKEQVPTTKELQAFIRANTECGYCTIPLTDKNFSLDHANPVSRGGSCKLDNLVACCSNCNSVKGALSVEEYKGLLLLVETWEDKGRSLKARLKRGWFGKRT